MAQTIPFAKVQRLLTTQFHRGGKADQDPVGQTKVETGVQTPLSSLLAARTENISTVHTKRRCVVVIVPFIGEDAALVAMTKRFEIRALKDCNKRREAPISPSAFFAEAVDFRDRLDRDIALQNQLAWIKRSEGVVVYTDLGTTPMMQMAINYAEQKQKPVEFRTLNGLS
jgi:hypothetical protein